MASSAIKGISIEIDGDTTKLDKALTNVNKNTRSLQTELRQVDKLLKLDPTNTDLLNQRQQILAQSISATSNKLDVLREAEKQVQAQMERGEASAESYREIQRQVIRCSQELDSLRTSAQQTSDALNGLGSEVEEAGQDLDEASENAGNYGDKIDSLKDTAKGAAVGVGAAVIGLASYATKFETEFDQALNSVATQTGATGDELEGLEETMENIYNNNFGEDIQDVADSMAAVKQQTDLSGQALQDMTEQALLMRDTFDMDVSESVRAANMMMEQFGVSSDEAYNLIAQGAQSGLDKNGDLLDTINEYSVQFQQLGLDADDMFNMLANGAESGTFSVDQLGDAVKEFGIRVKDGTADTAFEELGLDVEATKTAFGEGGEAAKQAMSQVTDALFNMSDPIDQNALGVTMFGTMWENLGADGVEALTNLNGTISTTTDALGAINEQKYDDLGNQFEELKRNVETDFIQPIGEELKPTLSELMDTVKENLPQLKETALSLFEKVKEFVSFVVNNSSTIISVIAGIAAGMAAWNVVSTISSLISVMKGLTDATKATAAAQKILNIVQAANPIGIIITLIATVVTALIALYATNEDFRNKVNAIWEKIKETASDVFGTIVDFFTVTIPEAIDIVIGFFKDLWDSIVSVFSDVGDWFTEKFKAAYEGITGIFANIGQWFDARWTDIKNALSTVATWYYTTWLNAFNAIVGVFKNIGSWFGARYTDIKNALSTVDSWFQSLFKNAYSKIVSVFSNIGSWFGNRWKDIMSALSAVTSWFETTFKNAYNKVTEVFGNIGSWFENRWKDIKNALSNVASGFKSIFTDAWKAIQGVFSTSTLKSFFGNNGMWGTIKGLFTDIGSKVGDAIGGAFKKAINSAIDTVEKAINGAIDLINNVIGAINSVNPLGDIPSVGHIDLPALANGGVLSNGEAIVAEAGPELISMVNGKTIVTPLTQSARNTAMESVNGEDAKATSIVQNNTFSSPKALSPYETARLNRNATRNLISQLRRG